MCDFNQIVQTEPMGVITMFTRTRLTQKIVTLGMIFAFVMSYGVNAYAATLKRGDDLGSFIIATTQDDPDPDLCC